MRVTKSTIIRTILVIVAILNFALERFGVDVIPVSESWLLMALETTIEIAIVVVGFWKNNSYTEKAIKADEFLRELRESE